MAYPGVSASACRVLPRWLGWAGMVFGAAAAVGTLGITLEVDVLYVLWFVGLFGFWLWTIPVTVVSVLRARIRRGTHADESAPAEA